MTLTSSVVCRGPLTRLLPGIALVQGTSDTVWGADLHGGWTHGQRSRTELSLHMNTRELRVVHRACQLFLPHLRGKCGRVLMDNSQFHKLLACSCERFTHICRLGKIMATLQQQNRDSGRCSFYSCSL